jgi:hypothetical protein
MSEEMYADFEKSGRMFSDFLWKIEDLQFDHIHELTISHHHVINDSYTIERLCRVFPNLQRLDISIEGIDAIIQFINSLNYLSSLSFQFKCPLNNQLILDRIEESIVSSFTYRFTKSSVHIWIDKNSISSSKDQLDKQEYTRNWFYYMLGQRSLLSIMLSCILITLLTKTSISIWDYAFENISMCKIGAFRIFQSFLFHRFIESDPEVIRKNDRGSTYECGYLFVAIFEIINYKYSFFNSQVS